MTTTPEKVEEVLLGPGELHFGGSRTRIRTLLGSCVAITVWHPRLQLGGMAHIMLPEAPASPVVAPGRYADTALDNLVGEIRRLGTRVEEYLAKIFGGGRMFQGDTPDIGARNLEAAVRLCRHHGFPLAVFKPGRRSPQTLVFELWSGSVWCKDHT